MTAFTISHPLFYNLTRNTILYLPLYFTCGGIIFCIVECIAFLGRVVALMTLLRAIVRQPPPAEPKPLVSHCGISYDGFLLMQKLGAPPIFFKPKHHQRQQPKITTSPFKKKGHEKTGWAIFFVYSHGTALSLIHSSRKGYWTSFRVTYYSNEILCPLTN